MGSEMCIRDRQSTVATSLWDGTPALPTQPSPATFRFLTALQTRMAEMGEDLWSPYAVDAVKKHVATNLADVLDNFSSEQEPVPAKSEETNDAAEPAEQASHHTTELRVQRLFDALYLSSAVGSLSQDVLKSTFSTLQGAAGVDTAAEQRMAKSATEYWKRTSLLCGLLAI